MLLRRSFGEGAGIQAERFTCLLRMPCRAVSWLSPLLPRDMMRPVAKLLRRGRIGVWRTFQWRFVTSCGLQGKNASLETVSWNKGVSVHPDIQLTPRQRVASFNPELVHCLWSSNWKIASCRNPFGKYRARETLRFPPMAQLSDKVTSRGARSCSGLSDERLRNIIGRSALPLFPGLKVELRS